MNRQYRLLVFDWDGTLVDSVGWIVKCIQQGAAEAGCDIPSEADCRSIIGLGLGEALQVLFPAQSQSVRDRVVQGYQRLYFSRQPSRSDFFEGVIDMLETFRSSGYLLAVATGKSRRGLDRAMQETGTAHLFHHSRCADETLSKPDPAMLHQLLGVTAVKPGNALMIGDSLHDLRMAARAGMDAVAVSCGAADADRLERENPVVCYSEPRQLLTLLPLGC